MARNNPYAGGYTVERYGTPAQGVHAIQIELNRRLYLDEERLTRKAGGFEALKRKLDAFVDALVGFDPASLTRP